MDHQAGVSHPQAKHSSAGEQGTPVSASISQEAPLVHSGVFGIQTYIITVSSARVPPESQPQTLWCCQRKEELGQSCASDTSECLIPWYQNPAEPSQYEVLQPGTRRTRPHSDLSSARSCISIAVIGPVIRFQAQRTGASLHQANHLSSSGNAGR